MRYLYSGMLELKLCGREEVEVAARLLIKAHAPTDATLQDVQDFYLPRLTGIFSHSLSSSDSSRVIILGMAPDGVVHAAYELPRIVQLDGILTLPRGYIATDPVNQGLGTEFFNGVTRLFEQVAFEIGQPVVHAPQASFRHTADFFLKRGYALIREEEGLPT